MALVTAMQFLRLLCKKAKIGRPHAAQNSAIFQGSVWIVLIKHINLETTLVALEGEGGGGGISDGGGSLSGLRNEGGRMRAADAGCATKQRHFLTTRFLVSLRF